MSSLACLPAVAAAQTPAQTSAADAAADADAATDTGATRRSTGPAVEESRSLFDPAPRQFQIGGRLSSVSGDPARWQRYEDLRDGLLFTDARYEHEWEETGQIFRASADNVGWRDQRFTGLFERPGLFRVDRALGRDPAVLQHRYENGIHVGRCRAC